MSASVLPLPRRADVVLRHVIVCYLRQYARNGVSWANASYEEAQAAGVTGAGLVLKSRNRSMLLDLKCGEGAPLDAALRQLEAWHVLGRRRWMGTLLEENVS